MELLIQYCQQSGLALATSLSAITDVIVSTDSPEVRVIAQQMGVSVHWRDEYLCGDAITLDAVIADAVPKMTDWDYVVTKKAIANFRWIDTVLGSGEKTVLDCELTPRREARRSLVLTRDMKAGEIINKEDIMPKRPGTGISPDYMNIIVGRKVIKDLKEDTILMWDMV